MTGDWDKPAGVEVVTGDGWEGAEADCAGGVVVVEEGEEEVFFSKSTARVLNADAGVV